eukprot:363418-Chlamydomonas_euryale.AAC.4
MPTSPNKKSEAQDLIVNDIVSRGIATHNYPCEKQGTGRYMPTSEKVCPWLLFIVIAKAGRTGNCKRVNWMGFFGLGPSEGECVARGQFAQHSCRKQFRTSNTRVLASLKMRRVPFMSLILGLMFRETSTGILLSSSVHGVAT